MTGIDENVRFLARSATGNEQDAAACFIDPCGIEDAAAQLRNGQKYLSAPGVVTIYNDHLGADHSELLRACLGDLTIAINPSTHESDPPFLGRNGVMRPNKNTAVSAVTYSSRQFPTISLLNPYAALPVAAQWLAGTVYHVNPNGDVVVLRGETR